MITTYLGKRVNLGEVVNGLQLALNEADLFEKSELLEISLILFADSLNSSLIEDTRSSIPLNLSRRDLSIPFKSRFLQFGSKR